MAKKPKVHEFHIEQETALFVANFLFKQSQWFEMEPWPDGWWQLTVKEENKKLVLKAILASKKFSVKIRWGAEQTRKDNKDAYAVYDFGSQTELDAFMKGVDEASGWTDYEVVK